MGINFRRVLAQNVQALMDASKDKNSQDKLAAKCVVAGRRIGGSTIGHLVSQKDDAPYPQLDTILAVAAAFKVDPWLLLLPEFDAKDPGKTLRMLELARRIAGLSKERQALLLDIFGEEPGTETNPGIPRSRDVLHTPRAGYSRKLTKP